MMNETLKKRVSFRFDQESIDILDKVSEVDDDLYKGRSRTWLIEYAIRQQYQPVVKETNGKK
jgi:hypothetical protein